MAKKTIAARLKSLRESANLTAQQLADRSGLHVRTINQIEQGRRLTPTMATLQAIAKALKVGLSEFDI